MAAHPLAELPAAAVVSFPRPPLDIQRSQQHQTQPQQETTSPLQLRRRRPSGVCPLGMGYEERLEVVVSDLVNAVLAEQSGGPQKLQKRDSVASNGTFGLPPPPTADDAKALAALQREEDHLERMVAALVENVIQLELAELQEQRLSQTVEQVVRDSLDSAVRELLAERELDACSAVSSEPANAEEKEALVEQQPVALPETELNGDSPIPEAASELGNSEDREASVVQEQEPVALAAEESHLFVPSETLHKHRRMPSGYSLLDDYYSMESEDTKRMSMAQPIQIPSRPATPQFHTPISAAVPIFPETTNPPEDSSSSDASSQREIDELKKLLAVVRATNATTANGSSTNTPFTNASSHREIDDLKTLLSQVRAVKARMLKDVDWPASPVSSNSTVYEDAVSVISSRSRGSYQEDASEYSSHKWDERRRGSGDTFGPADPNMRAIERKESSSRFSASLHTISEQGSRRPSSAESDTHPQLQRRVSLFPDLAQLRSEQASWKLMNNRPSRDNLSLASSSAPSSAASRPRTLLYTELTMGAPAAPPSSPLPSIPPSVVSLVSHRTSSTTFDSDEDEPTTITGSRSNAKALKMLGLLPSEENTRSSLSSASPIKNAKALKTLRIVSIPPQVVSSSDNDSDATLVRSPNAKSLKTLGILPPQDEGKVVKPTAVSDDTPPLKKVEDDEDSDETVNIIRRPSSAGRSNAKALKTLGIISRTDADKGVTANSKAMKLLGLSQEDVMQFGAAGPASDFGSKSSRFSSLRSNSSRRSSSKRDIRDSNIFLTSQRSVDPLPTNNGHSTPAMELTRIPTSSSLTSDSASASTNASDTPTLKKRSSMTTLRRKSMQVVAAALPAFSSVPVPPSPSAKLSVHQVLHCGSVQTTKHHPGALFRSWKRRYCVLTRGFLYLYPAAAAALASMQHQPEENPSDVLYVGVGTEFRVVHKDAVGKRCAFGFSVRSGSAKVLYFACDDPTWKAVVEQLTLELKAPPRIGGGGATSLPRSMSTPILPITEPRRATISSGTTGGATPAGPRADSEHASSPPLPSSFVKHNGLFDSGVSVKGVHDRSLSASTFSLERLNSNSVRSSISSTLSSAKSLDSSSSLKRGDSGISTTSRHTASPTPPSHHSNATLTRPTSILKASLPRSAAAAMGPRPSPLSPIASPTMAAPPPPHVPPPPTPPPSSTLPPPPRSVAATTTPPTTPTSASPRSSPPPPSSPPTSPLPPLPYHPMQQQQQQHKTLTPHHRLSSHSDLDLVSLLVARRPSLAESVTSTTSSTASSRRVGSKSGRAPGGAGVGRDHAAAALDGALHVLDTLLREDGRKKHPGGEMGENIK
ncbi:hypothetical protein DFJ77DRAFT_506094 [Powellomyces hirtus]|nr:hypothetical protein DFJ77DRAFT_506094 [Powellomyces hirtus]